MPPTNNQRCHDIGQCVFPPPGALRCPIDGGLVKDAVKSTICGHVYGLQCILAKLMESEKCPACNMPMDASDLEPAEEIRELVNDTLVQCREGENVGSGRCSWTGKLRDEPKHANGAECGVHKVPCPFCNRRFEAGAEFEQHKSVCDECIVICPQCSADMPRKQLLAHQAQCKASLPVPLKASNDLLKRMNSAPPASPSRSPKRENKKRSTPPPAPLNVEEIEKTPPRSSSSATQEAGKPQVEAIERTPPPSTYLQSPSSAAHAKSSTKKKSAKKSSHNNNTAASPVPLPQGNKLGTIPASMAELEQRLGHKLPAGGNNGNSTKKSYKKTLTPMKKNKPSHGKQMGEEFTVNGLDETASPSVSAKKRTGKKRHDHIGGLPAEASREDHCASMELGDSAELFSPPPPASRGALHSPLSNDGTASPTQGCPFTAMGCTTQHRSKDMLKPATLQQHLLVMCSSFQQLQSRVVSLELKEQQQADEIRRLKSALVKATKARPVPSPAKANTSAVDMTTPQPQRARPSADAENGKSSSKKHRSAQKMMFHPRQPRVIPPPSQAKGGSGSSASSKPSSASILRSYRYSEKSTAASSASKTARVRTGLGEIDANVAH